MRLGHLSINDSYTPWISEHDGKNRIDLTPVLFKIWLLEEGYVLAKKYIDTLKVCDDFEMLMTELRCW